jgi:hypothetical protein
MIESLVAIVFAWTQARTGEQKGGQKEGGSDVKLAVSLERSPDKQKYGHWKYNWNYQQNV